MADPPEKTLRLDAASRWPKQSTSYRRWAAEAEARAADATSGEVRDAYRSLALSWLQMAADTERRHQLF